ncbi:Late secretory pathway [Hyphodiscus hymeniophilus]|uniref:Late secretory pathway n=1 Tax=Hyphodiscus hymeniophilus TaxID=353542 RepID=A0A9P6VJJ4_9HELO|nr:Late secretory pathway [Hyphodiscus hymeniophilus]
MRYQGSEEFIRLQFEEYLVSLISSVKCHNYMTQHASNPRVMLPQVEGDPATDFNLDWIEAWSRSENYRIWNKNTDSHLFDFVEPKHPFPGGLTIDDVQRRLAEQVKEFHLDERFAVGKEALGRNFQAGREKASTVFNKLYADMEALRESQRRKHEEQRREAEMNGQHSPGFGAPDLNGARQTVQSVGSKAGAYIGSWGTWMGEKRKVGWGRNSSAGQANTLKKENLNLPTRSVRDEKVASVVTPIVAQDTRPKTQESYEESLFDAETAGHASADVKQVDAHPATPSKLHEFIDDGPAKAVPNAAVGEEVTKSTKVWEEKATSKVDEHARSSAVAEAVEAATATPISP